MSGSRGVERVRSGVDELMSYIHTRSPNLLHNRDLLTLAPRHRGPLKDSAKEPPAAAAAPAGEPAKDGVADEVTEESKSEDTEAKTDSEEKKPEEKAEEKPEEKRQGPPKPHNRFSQPKLRLLVDGESCLERLFGGFVTDWCRGGEWSRVVHFLRDFVTQLRSHQVGLTVYLDGTLSPELYGSINEARRERILKALRHIQAKGTPPPKGMWVPPVGLRSTLRALLRQQAVPIHLSLAEHQLEIMDMVWEQDVDFLAAEGAPFLLCRPPGFLCAQSLRLTYGRGIESKEILLSEVADNIHLPLQHFPFLAALLGGRVLSTKDLLPFYQNLCPDAAQDADKLDFHLLIPAIIRFIKDQAGQGEEEGQEGQEAGEGKVVDPEAVARAVFAGREGAEELEKLFLTAYAQHCPKSEPHRSLASARTGQPERDDLQAPHATLASDARNSSPSSPAQSTPPPGRNGDSSAAESGSEGGPGPAAAEKEESWTEPAEGKGEEELGAEPRIPESHNRLLTATAAQRHIAGQMHHAVYHLLTAGEVRLEPDMSSYARQLGIPVSSEDFWAPHRQRLYALLFDLNHKLFIASRPTPTTSSRPSPLPKAADDAEDTQDGDGDSGLPTQELSQDTETEIITEAKADDETKTLLDRSVAAVSRTEVRPILVREWGAEGPVIRKAVQMGWKGVPTLRRLWFDKDKVTAGKRLQTFLATFRADTRQFMAAEVVPRHLLGLCAVLRYMASSSGREGKRAVEGFEVDAVLSTALSPSLFNPPPLLDPKEAIHQVGVTIRCVELGALISRGLDQAILANDVCGAPLPAAALGMWCSFDGRLLQSKLALAQAQMPVLSLCENSADAARALVRLRAAILDGLRYPQPPPCLSVVPLPQHMARPQHFAPHLLHHMAAFSQGSLSYGALPGMPRPRAIGPGPAYPIGAHAQPRKDVASLNGPFSKLALGPAYAQDPRGAQMNGPRWSMGQPQQSMSGQQRVVQQPKASLTSPRHPAGPQSFGGFFSGGDGRNSVPSMGGQQMSQSAASPHSLFPAGSNAVALQSQLPNLHLAQSPGQAYANDSKAQQMPLQQGQEMWMGSAQMGAAWASPAILQTFQVSQQTGMPMVQGGGAQSGMGGMGQASQAPAPSAQSSSLPGYPMRVRLTSSSQHQHGYAGGNPQPQLLSHPQPLQIQLQQGPSAVDPRADPRYSPKLNVGVLSSSSSGGFPALPNLVSPQHQPSAAFPQTFLGSYAGVTSQPHLPHHTAHTQHSHPLQPAQAHFSQHLQLSQPQPQPQGQGQHNAAHGHLGQALAHGLPQALAQPSHPAQPPNHNHFHHAPL